MTSLNCVMNLSSGRTKLVGSCSCSPTIRFTSASHITLSRVPGSQVLSSELEQEGGRLVYSFDLKNSSKPGLDEVLVDAITGAVVSVKHESPAQEADEAKRDGARRGH